MEFLMAAASSFVVPRKHLKGVEAYLAASPDDRTDDPVHGAACDVDFKISQSICKEMGKRGLGAVTAERRYFAALYAVETGINGDGLSHVVQHETEWL